MKYFISILTILFITSCALLTPNPAHFKRTQIETKYLTFSVWEQESIQPSKPIRIYIEGDGNPNPYHQIALYYAEQDPSNNVIYLARPCQWTNDKICETKPEIYKGQRFHPEMIREIEEVILLLINKYQAPTVELVGYDGGATIALNIAPKINTRKIIAIAGILALQPKTLVLDEPTAGLDPRGTKYILELFKKLNEQGTTIVFVTHDINIVYEYATDVIVMNEGKVMMQTVPEKLFAEDVEQYSLETPLIQKTVNLLLAKGMKLDVSKIRSLEDLVKEIARVRK